MANENMRTVVTNSLHRNVVESLLPHFAHFTALKQCR